MAVSILMISISTRSIFKLPGAIASGATGAAQKLFSSVGNFVSQTIFSIQELADLRSQYDALAEKLKAYETLERNYADTMAENTRLKEQLGFANSITAIKASARIIAKDPGNIYSSYIIDKGISSGIEKNMAVAAFQNGVEGLAGKILDSRKTSSVVLPLFDQRFFVSARFARTRTEGLVNGQGNPDDPLVMRYVSKLNAAEIQIGDMIVTSGLDSIYPPDMAIGRVAEIQLPEYGSSAVILLGPALNFSKLEYLFVVRKEELPIVPEAQISPEAANKER
jgi:rod shape-determining protein MreC